VDHNLISMSLYAGPSNAPGHGDWLGQVKGGRGNDTVLQSYKGPHGLGWVATGDAQLSGSRRQKAFLGAYRRYLGHVGVLVTPHHGAAASFDPRVLTSMPLLMAGVAAVGPNGYGHPNDSVRDAVNAHPQAQFVRVCEDETAGMEFNQQAQ
jgi:hypothetical protein